MKKTTVTLIKTALKMDPTVPPEIRMAIVGAINGNAHGDLTGEMSLAEAADYLGMNRVTLWRKVARGHVEATRHGKKYYFSGATVKALKSAS